MSENTSTEGLILELKDANIYQDETLVLHDVNLTVERGEFVYLIGKTGSGKSSLLKTLYGDLPFSDGEGHVVGFDLKKMTWKKVPKLRRKLGIVFQDFNLLMDRSVEENLMFVLKATGWKDKKSMKEQIHFALEKVGIHTKSHKKPHALSGGEQQRLVLARALLNDPVLILADEPTGNLDPETSDEILKLLKKINADTGTPVLMATHDYYVIEKYPGRILRCQDGIISEAESIRM